MKLDGWTAVLIQDVLITGSLFLGHAAVVPTPVNTSVTRE
eukprot:COSAG03_NODE_17290_length_379_cov_0.728571_1_plen_39_part_10